MNIVLEKNGVHVDLDHLTHDAAICSGSTVIHGIHNVCPLNILTYSTLNIWSDRNELVWTQSDQDVSDLLAIQFVLMLFIPVNTFSVMSG